MSVESGILRREGSANPGIQLDTKFARASKAAGRTDEAQLLHQDQKRMFYMPPPKMVADDSKQEEARAFQPSSKLIALNQKIAIQNVILGSITSETGKIAGDLTKS